MPPRRRSPVPAQAVVAAIVAAAEAVSSAAVGAVDHAAENETERRRRRHCELRLGRLVRFITFAAPILARHCKNESKYWP